MSMTKETVDAFKKLVNEGYSLIPLKGKVPVEREWQKWCKEKRPFDPDEFTDNNAGICCGPASGILALDIDDAEKFSQYISKNVNELPETREHETGSGKRHLLYMYPDNGRRYGNRTFEEHGFDIRGIGGQIVAPGSIHPVTGRTYRILKDLPVAEPPDWILRLSIQESNPTDKDRSGIPDEPAINIDGLPISPKTKELILNGKPKGERSEAIMSVLNALVYANLSDEEIIQLFDRYPIGEKYREKRNAKKQWLKTEIKKARNFINHSKPLEVIMEDELVFPAEVITGVAGHFAELYSNHLESPPHFFYICFLTCLGSILSGDLTLESSLNIQPRLYTILLGESAVDRKSTAIQMTVEMFSDANINFNRCDGVGSAEGLHLQLDGHPKTILVIDEFSQFVGKCKPESSVLLPMVNTLFESNRYEYRTKTKHIPLKDAHLSILGASTLDTFERVWDSSFRDIGFNNRLFMVPGSGQKRFSLPVQIPDREKKILKKDIQKIVKTAKGLKLKISPEAYSLYDHWYINLPQSVNTARLDQYALRFMELLTVNDFKKIVDEEVVKKVLAMMDWQFKVRRFHDPIDADTVIARLEIKIRRYVASGRKTRREVWRKIHAERVGVWFFDKAVENLIRAQEIRGYKDGSLEPLPWTVTSPVTTCSI